MSSPVVIKYDFNVVEVVPSMAGLLRRKLCVRRKVREERVENGKKTTVMVVRKENLARELPDKLVTFRGLLDRVVQILEKDGIAYELQPLSASTLPEPRYDRIEKLRPGQDEALACLAAYDRCIIDAVTGWGKGFLIRQVCRMWPQARIVVCTYDSGIVRQLYGDLRAVFHSEVGMVGDGETGGRCRIVCAVDRSLHHVSGKIDIFIYDEVHRAAAPDTSGLLSEITAERRFGFSATPMCRGDKADLLTEALFGPVVIKFPYQDAQAGGLVVPVAVIVADTSRLPVIHSQKQWTVEKFGLKVNVGRNRLVASCVADARRLCGEDARILVLCDKVEHVFELNEKYLPDFTAVYGAVSEKLKSRYGRDRLPPGEKQKRLKAMRQGEIRCIVGNGIGVGTDIPELDAVVVAAAPGGKIFSNQFAGRVVRIGEGRKKVGLVYDLNDKHNIRLSQNWDTRLGTYEEKGWAIRELGQDASLDELAGAATRLAASGAA